MKWQDGRRSDNVEDRRDEGGGGSVARGARGVRLGFGGILLVVLFSWLTGQNPIRLLSVIQGSIPDQAGTGAGNPAAPAPGAARPPGGAADPQADFIAVVLADTEDTWGQIFTQMQRRYERPKLVLFSSQVESACGLSSSAVGPFYCPGDHKVYLDLSFFRELSERFHAPGDFARAYVVAHEIGHHVQVLLGISRQVDELRERASREQGNALSVRQELQADCLAGVWGHHAGARSRLEPGDVEAGLGAAAAIGDDQLQRDAGRRVRPESWTHGSSQMRVRWFRRGFESGRVDQCDTFTARDL